MTNMNQNTKRTRHTNSALAIPGLAILGVTVVSLFTLAVDNADEWFSMGGHAPAPSNVVSTEPQVNVVSTEPQVEQATAVSVDVNNETTATLKMGIENMLKHYIPEVVEVRAI